MGEYVTYRDNSGHYGDFEHGRSSQIAYESDHWENCEFWISLEKMRKGKEEREREREREVLLFFEMLVGIERTIHDLGEFKLFVNNNKMCFRMSKVKSAVF